MGRDWVIGLIKAEGFLFPQYIERYMVLISGILQICGIVLENLIYLENIEKQKEYLQYLNFHDQQTQLYNRAYFENALEKGDKIRKRLIEQYSLFENCSVDLKKIYDEFNDRIKEIGDLLNNNTVDHNDANRLIRRKNDLISAQLLSANSSAQFELSKANVATLIDKFESIEKILKPVISQNIQLSKEMYRVF